MKNLLGKTLFCTLIYLLMFSSLAECKFNDYSLAHSSIQSIYGSGLGLGSQGVNDVAQTPDGYIWFANFSGLFRYDGKNILKIDTNIYPNYTATSVNKLFVADDGTLYIASNNDGLFKYSHNNFERIEYSSEILPSSISYISQSNSGTIYISTNYGIGKVQDNKLHSPEKTGLYTIAMSQFIFDKKNYLWGVVNDGSIVVAHDDDIVSSWDFDKKYAARAIYKTKQNKILIGTTSGHVLEVEFDNNLKIINTYHDNGLRSLNGIYEDATGKIWAYSDHSIGYFDENMTFITLKGLEIDTFIQNMLVDHQNNFWFASSREGALSLSPSYFNQENFPSTSSTYVNATVFWNNHLYIATDEGVLIAGNEEKSNAITSYFSGVRVRAMLVDKDNNFWIGTYSDESYGLVKINEKMEFSNYTSQNGLSSDWIYALFEKSDGTIWVGTDSGVSVIKDHNIIENYIVNDVLHNQRILSLYENSNNVMIVGTDGSGMFFIEDGIIIKKLTIREGLQSDVILKVAEDKENGTLFITTGSNILSSYNYKGRVETIPSFVSDGNIYDIKFFKNDLLVLSENAVYKIDPTTLWNNKAKFLIYDSSRGLRTHISSFSQNIMHKNNTLYICASNNVYSLNFDKKVKDSIASPVALTSISLDSKVYYKDFEKITVGPNVERVTFNFAYLTFDYKEDSSVFYMLEGFDKEYKEINFKNVYSASYTNLPYGEYSFKVKGRDYQGRESSNISSVPLAITPNWYETKAITIFFVFFAFVFAVGLIWYFHKIRVAAIFQKNLEFRNITREFVFAFVGIIDAKDTYTNGHSRRVAYYSLMIAKSCGFPATELENIYYTALLHDIGKVGVPDQILKKPTRLSEREFKVIQAHATMGAHILRNITLIDNVGLGTEYHHEKYDGSGYPKGLAGSSIPLVARIICAADSFDAMTSGRAYCTSTIEQGVEELKKCAGTHFDPYVVEIFTNLIETKSISLYDGTASLKNFQINFEALID